LSHKRFLVEERQDHNSQANKKKSRAPSSSDPTMNLEFYGFIFVLKPTPFPQLGRDKILGSGAWLAPTPRQLGVGPGWRCPHDASLAFEMAGALFGFWGQSRN
jgi:hypothetical protein